MRLSAQPIVFFLLKLRGCTVHFYFLEIDIENKQLSAYWIVLENRAKKGERKLGGKQEWDRRKDWKVINNMDRKELFKSY